MLNELYKCVSHFYGGTLKAHRNTSNIERALQATAEAYWRSRVRDSFQGSIRQVSIDVSGTLQDGNPIMHSTLSGTTTKFNTTEAKVISWTIRDMLLFKPPVSTDKIQYRQCVPSDFIVVTPYTGQALEVRKQLRESILDQPLVDTEGVLVATTNHSQGKQRNIAFFSPVVNPGVERLGRDARVPLSSVFDDHNINVSLSRQRIGRHIVGGLGYLTQMKYDDHPQSKRHAKFFHHIKELCENDLILTLGEWHHTMNTGQKPDYEKDGVGQAKAF